MKTYLLPAVALSACLALVTCQNPWGSKTKTQTETKQTIDMNLSKSDKTWSVVKQSNKDVMVTLMPNGQTPANWKEGIRTTTFLYGNNADITAEKFVQNEIYRAKKYCSQVNANVLSQTPNDTTYQLNIANCSGGFPNQILIGKAFNGVDGVYAVRYSAKPGMVSQNEMDTMADVVKSSRLVSNT